jgi:signal transduction histidine kinase
MTFFPRSLSGQIALVMAGALLVASAVNFIILLGERYRAGINEQIAPAIARFVDVAMEVEENPPQGQMALGRRGARLNISPRSVVDIRGLPRNDRLEARLVAVFEQAGSSGRDIRAARIAVERPARGRFGPPDEGPPGLREDMMRRGSFPGERMRGNEVVLSTRLPDGRWLNGMFFSPAPPPDEIARLAAGTFVTFAFVLGAALWIARRLSRPLADLANATARVGAGAEPEEVTVRGPSDVRQTLEAFNAMSRRVSLLLNEKDVMLGALGHDLRTPLASLRIRIETMEPEAERQKAIRTIEETTRLLEDILELARQGKSSEPVQTIDISVLVEDIVEDYSETGAPVTLAATEKAPVACRPMLFRRAMRNLVDNAVAYGERARLSVSRSGGEALIRIEDDGPGIPGDALKSAADPFVRGEASRSRKTGGAGLGLTLADAIAKAHGGGLTLENRQPHGLAVTIRLPLISPGSPAA